MIRRFSTTFAVFSMCLDALIVSFSLNMASVLRPLMSNLAFAQNIPAGEVILPKLNYVIFPLIWIAVLSSLQIYKGRRYFRAFDEFGALMTGAILAAVLMAGFLYLSFRDISRLLFITFVLVALLSQTFYRSVVRLVWRSERFRLAPRQRVVVLGTGEIAEKVCLELTTHPYFSMNMVGFLGDQPTTGYPYLGKLKDAYSVIVENSITDIVIALPNREQEQMNTTIQNFYDLAINIWVVPDYFSLTLHQAKLENFGSIPMMNLRASALSDIQRIQKRFIDLLLVIMELPIILPVSGFIVLLIKLDSKGKVFFLQDRIGENGKIFKMIKFRTMVSDAESKRHLVEFLNENGESIHKVKDDPRLTRVGKILRRMSLDELPQIVNVLKGDMSIVGPRPEMPDLVEKYDLWQRKRFAIPQGITGWWQVNGRSELPMHLNTKYDLYYIQHYSIWLDIVILFKTIWTVLQGKGAF